MNSPKFNVKPELVDYIYRVYTKKVGAETILDDWSDTNEMLRDVACKMEPKTFIEAVEPLMKWMSENQHPHTTVIVTGTRSELVEGLQCHLTDEFIVD